MSEKGLVEIKRIGDTTYVTIKEKGEEFLENFLINKEEVKLNDD